MASPDSEFLTIPHWFQKSSTFNILLLAADQYAHAALHLVPYWHYVRDILLPQIQEAKGKAKAQ